MSNFTQGVLGGTTAVIWSQRCVMRCSSTSAALRKLAGNTPVCSPAFKSGTSDSGSRRSRSIPTHSGMPASAWPARERNPGIVLKMEGARLEAIFGSQLIAEGTSALPVVMTSIRDDRFGAGTTFDTNGDAGANPPPGSRSIPGSSRASAASGPGRPARS